MPALATCMHMQQQPTVSPVCITGVPPVSKSATSSVGHAGASNRKTSADMPSEDSCKRQSGRESQRTWMSTTSSVAALTTLRRNSTLELLSACMIIVVHPIVYDTYIFRSICLICVFAFGILYELLGLIMRCN